MRLSPSRAFLSLAGLMVCLVFITGCRFLIPEDPSAPRYNKVLGGKRVPELNYDTMESAPSAPMSMAPVPTAPVVAMTHAAPEPYYPPASPQTQRMAQQRLSQPAYEYQQAEPPQEERGFWDRMAFWRDTNAPTLEQTDVRREMAQRQMPAQNTSMASVGYPQLSAVPQTPANTAAYMSGVRNQLEQDRYASGQAAWQLQQAAAAEPTLMPPPVMATPIPGPVTAYPQPQGSGVLEPIQLRPPQPGYSAPSYYPYR